MKSTRKLTQIELDLKDLKKYAVDPVYDRIKAYIDEQAEEIKKLKEEIKELKG